MQKIFIVIIKTDAVTILYSKYYGVEPIKNYQFIKRKKRNGLINEACIDYLREGEY